MVNKSNPIGIRFDIEKLEFIKIREKLKSNQQAVDFLLNKYWWDWKVPVPTSKEAPPLTLKQELGTTSSLVERPPFLSLTPSKSFEQYKAEKRECGCDEDWEKVKGEIEADQYLSSKQKDLLIKYS